MRVLYKSLVATILCIAVSVFMFADISQAKKGGSSGSSSSKVKIDVRAELEPLDGSGEEDAEGQARHKKETRTRNGETITKKDEFKATVKIPVPSPALGITDEASAEGAEVHLLVSGSTSADCLMEFDEFDDDDDELQAEFKLDVRLKKGSVRDKRGTCGGVIPNAQAGDMATATVNGGTAFLEGTFEMH